jgi:hypothetical protein
MAHISLEYLTPSHGILVTDELMENTRIAGLIEGGVMKSGINFIEDID